jgi:hypothetical protein
VGRKGIEGEEIKAAGAVSAVGATTEAASHSQCIRLVVASP